jgi:hypothetical protein
LPIPLRTPDPDAWVDLQTVFATVYERARYRHQVNYEAAPPVRVSEDMRAWIAGRVQARQP